MRESVRVQQREGREVGPRNDILILGSEGVWVAEKETEKKRNGEAEAKQEARQQKHDHCFLDSFLSNITFT